METTNLHDDDILRPPEVAERLNTTVGTLRWMRHAGTGPKHFKIGPRSVRYLRRDVEQWLSERYAQPA